MLGLLLWGGLAYIAGALSVVGFIWWWYSVHPSKPDFKPVVQETHLPEELAKVLKQEGGYKRRETCLALNLLLQFFFQENRYDAGILHWLTGMLTQEFSTMLQEQKALSKIIKTMQIHHLDLGTEFPIIKALTPKHVDLNAEASQLEELDLCVELEYNGNFQLVVDATSRFKKSGKITIKVAHLSGYGRLQFTRHPFTHWSFSFYQEPVVTFDISSKIQGLHIPRLTSFIATQLRSILKRKHTLPYYKLRAAPLIKRITFHEEEGGVVPPGKLEISVVKFTRLQSNLLGTELYTSVVVTEIPLVSIVEDQSGSIWTTQDLTLRRPSGTPVGILFRNSDDHMLAIEVVYPGSPAHLAGLKKNDIILTINQQPLISGPQAAKLFSAASNSANVVADIKLRIKRCIYHEHRKMAADSKLGGPDTASATNDDSQGRSDNTCAPTALSSCGTYSSRSGVARPSLHCGGFISTSSGGGGCNGGAEEGGGASSTGSGASSFSSSGVGGGSGRHGWSSNVLDNSAGGCDGNSASDGNILTGSGVGSSFCSGGGGSSGGGGGGSGGSGSSGIVVTTGDEDVAYTNPPPRAVSPSALLAGLVGGLNTGRPSKHRSLPGSPILHRANRNRLSSARDGEVSTSTKSTPDSSHNNSPELKRRVLDLNASNTEANLNLSLPSKSPGVQEKTPLGMVSSTGFARQVDKFAQEKSHQTSSNQSSKASTPTADTLLLPRAETRNVTKKLSIRNRNALKMLQSQIVMSSSDPVLQSDFEFEVEEGNKFLHIGLWSRSGSSVQDSKDVDAPEIIKDSKGKSTEMGKDPGYDNSNKGNPKCKPSSKDSLYPEDTLVGYINIPLTCIIPETTSNTRGYVVKVFPLTPPDPKCPEMASSTLQQHKGFTPAFCYGDITLAITYQPVDRKENVEKKDKEKINSSTCIEDDSSIDGGLSDEDEAYLGEIIDERPHDFKRTHFHSTTQCDFCKKKIWLKDANQCGECGIICHKKCVAKCEQETVCDVSGLRFKEQSSLATPDMKGKTQDPLSIPDNRDTPEIITTSAVGGGCESDSPGQTPPVSPHASIVGNPFHIDDDNFDGIEVALDRIAMYPHDERLITMARESAKDLYSNIAGSQRSKKINSMMEKLQAAVDREGEIRVDLARQEKETADAGDDLGRTKISLQITQCDARTQSLALLTLHYCTALQYCTDKTEDEESVKEATKDEVSEVTEQGTG
ncbi:PDZ domain containing 8 isoform X2 [Oratosquilla oratoria]|uniref:PDZ domain containing 8 isoform X2 n=1 Tax=Oratosquilla oratoria TaxID=337810 RepID=UPI003F761C7E